MAPRQRHNILSQPSLNDDNDCNLTTTTALIIDTTAHSDSNITKPLLMDGSVSLVESSSSSSSPLVTSQQHLQDAATAAAEYTTPTATTIEIARDRHDIFNIIALLFVIAATIINWDFRYILQGPTMAWKGQYFYWNWATTVSYFLIDLIWVACIPICVKSPDVIIKHHFVAIAYLSGPIAWPEYRWFMGACLSVEINTWFLILRRVLYKRKDHIHYMITEIVSLLFYITWIAIRVFLYPMIMYIFIQMAYERILETGILFHWPMIFMPVHFFLCVLNLKWTYDLFLPIVTKYCTISTTTATNNGKREVGVSSGL